MIGDYMYVYLATPMEGLSEEHIRKDMAWAKDWLGKKFGQPFYIVDSYIKPDKIAGKGETYMLGLQTGMMTLKSVDLIAFMPGWRYARTCKIQREIANLYGLPYIDIPADDYKIPEIDF